MVREKKRGIRSEKGFTMIELIVVIAIMGILSAIVVPSFTSMTRKTRLRADISTVQQVQAQIDLYVAEHDGQYPSSGGSEFGDGDPIKGDIVKKLVEGNYIKSSDTTGTGDELKIKLQSQDVAVIYSGGKEHAILSVTGEKEKKILKTLSGSDQIWAEEKTAATGD